jgi:recombination protein RecA
VEGGMTKISDVQAAVTKEYKDDKVMTVGVSPEDPGRIPTGIFPFDLAMGGGIPLQRISLLWGKEDSMKSSLAMLACANAQRLYPDKKAVWIDIEYVQPKNAEQVVDITESILHTEDASIVVLDSLAALVTQQELDKSAEDAIVGKTGLVVNKLYRKVTQALGEARREGRHPALLVINQIRFKIGVMYGSPETLPGGPSFLFGSSMSLRLYGKDVMENAVSKTLPAYKEVSLQIKKHKVPILATTAVAQIALQPIAQYGLDIGQSYDWNTLLSYLKSLELLTKSKKGWDFVNPETGEVVTYPTQDKLKDQVFADPKFGDAVKNALIAKMMQGEEVIE